MTVIHTLVSRMDSWVNAMTGLGTLRDKLSYVQPVPGGKLGDGALETLFNEDDIARRIVAKLPREAMRRGFTIDVETEDAQTGQAPDGYESEPAAGAQPDLPPDLDRLMQDRLTQLGALTKLRDSWIWARLYGGGSGVFVGADDGRAPDQPLNEAGIRTIAFLNVVKRPQLTVKQRYEDLSSPHFGEPEIYTATPTTSSAATLTSFQRGGIDIHASRMILFDGGMTAQMTQQSPSGWDDSVLQNGYAALQQTATAWQSVAHLMTDASQGVLKVANLVDLIASGGQEALRTRVQMMDLARSVCRAILVDAERESFERVSTSFAGLPEVMDRLMMRVASAAEMPVTLLFGRSPAGLNATGESDIRGWYDVVADAQTDVLKPRLERLLRLMFAAKDSPTRGRVPDRWCVEFNPLWQPTDKEVADTDKVKADTYVALVGAGIMTDVEAGIGLAPDFPTINVEHRQELMEADLEEGRRPGEINTPEPPPELGEGSEGGSKGDGPKGRTDAEQPRVPKGSATGGQFASKTTISGGATPEGRAHADRLIEGEIGATRRHANHEVVTQLGVEYGGAAHQPTTGKIFLSEGDSALLGAPRPEKKGKLQEAYDRAVHVFVHESTHAYGPEHPKRGEYPVIEEVTTDLVAIRITGHAPVYGANIQQVDDAIVRVLGVDQSTARQMASDAARKYKSVAGNLSDEPPTAFAGFVTSDKRDELAQVLRNQSLLEEPEARAAEKRLGPAVRTWRKEAKRGDDDALRDDGSDKQRRIPKGQPGGGRWFSTKTPGGKAMNEGKALAVAHPSSIEVPAHLEAQMTGAVKGGAKTKSQVLNRVAPEQRAQAEEWTDFWVEESTDDAAEIANAGVHTDGHFARAQYAATQALLKQRLPELQAKGVVDKDGYVTLYRGITADAQGEALEAALATSRTGAVEMDVRATSSWSESHASARRNFASHSGIVVEHRVHYTNAFAYHENERWDENDEYEWTLINPSKRFTVIRADETAPFKRR